MQRVRTEAEMPFQVPLLHPEELHLHHLIAEKVLHLHQLGMTVNQIAAALKVDWHTVKKSLDRRKDPD